MLKYFKSYCSIIKLYISKKEYDEIIKDEFLFSYIPSLEIGKYKEYDASIKITKSNINHIDFKYPNIIYYYKDFDSKDIISLVEYVLERAREEKGIICIHGASSIYKNKLIISWGGTTGMGKTTLALEIAKLGHFYSDEKVLIDLNNMTGVGGIRKQYISNDYWRKKYNTEKKYIDIFKDYKTYYISSFIQPIICNSDEYILNRWDNSKFFWHLYEESCRKIRGTSRMFFKNTYPAISLDTFELAQKRLELIKEFTNKIDGYYYKGNIDNIISLLENKIIQK